VACHDWVAAIERQLPQDATQTVIVAHSLGCLAVAHWAVQSSRAVLGALLVAVPDPASIAFPREAATGFAPLPAARLPFPSIVVSSTNDPYGSADYARACAQTWGSELADAGAKGHLNAASNLGDWPEGFRLLETIRNR
jgi:predicted alpha/beta hydrolase family esterase